MRENSGCRGDYIMRLVVNLYLSDLTFGVAILEAFKVTSSNNSAFVKPAVTDDYGAHYYFSPMISNLIVPTSVGGLVSF